MAIDKRGEYWKGTEFADLAEYLAAYTEDGYPAEVIRQSVCTCGHTVFRLEGDTVEGCARRTCDACGTAAFIAGSEEYWDEADPEPCVCPCRCRRFEVGVGFSLRQEGEGKGEVRWITVAERCVVCGVLGSYVDWKIGYSPSRHLLDQA